MSKLKKLLILFLMIVSIILMSNTISIAVSLVDTKYNVTGTTITDYDLANIATNQKDKWFNSPATDFIGKYTVLHTSKANYQYDNSSNTTIGMGTKFNAECIGHQNTSESGHDVEKNYYRIVNLIDIDKNNVKVYSIGKTTTYNITAQNDVVKIYLRLAYMYENNNHCWNPMHWMTNYKKNVNCNPTATGCLNDAYKVSGYLQYSRTTLQNNGLDSLDISNTDPWDAAVDSKIKEFVTEIQKPYKFSVSASNPEIQIRGENYYIGPYYIDSSNTSYDKIVGKSTDNGQFVGWTTEIGGKPNSAFSELNTNGTGAQKTYIVLKNVDMTKTVTINLRKQRTYYRTRLMMLRGSAQTDGGGQNLNIFRSEKITDTTPLITLSAKANLQIKKEDFDTGEKLEGIKFKVYNQTAKKWLKIASDGKISFDDKFNNATKLTTNKDGYAYVQGLSKDSRGYPIINNLPIGNYVIYETDIPENLSDYYEITAQDNINGELITAKKISENNIRGNTTVVVTGKNRKDYMPLQIEKKDENGKLLSGIGFKIYSYAKQGWLKITNNKVTDYVDFNEATELVTTNGLTPEIKKVPVGQIMVVETNAGPYKDIYELGTFNFDGEDLPGEIKEEKYDVKANANNLVIIKCSNEQDYISLSGYVWEDIPGFYESKEATRNNIYDSNDYLINGIKVYLKDTNGNIVTNGNGELCETTTSEINNKNGFYRFEKIDMDKLMDYYVEFEYDGITYQSFLLEHIKIDGINTSKALETQTNRDKFNNAFSEIIGIGQEITNLNDNNIELKYKKQEDKTVILSNSLNVNKSTMKDNNNNEIKIATINNNGDSYNGGYTSFPIYATTKNADFNLKSQYNKLIQSSNEPIHEIENINLGLYEREKPDLRVEKDVFQADVGINGQNFVYKYHANLPEKGYDTTVGVQFQNSRTENYKLPIYRADAKYESEDKGLNISVVYKIALVNESTSVYAKVNSIDEYFSKEYVLSKIYAGDENGFKEDITNKEGIEIKQITELAGTNYNAYRISGLDIAIAPLKPVQNNQKNSSYLYLKFDLPKDQYFDNVNENKILDKTLKNVIEISSYNIYSDADCKNLYAGIDSDSIPRNLNNTSNENIENKNNYEDDTNQALGLNIVDVGDRQINGIVFEDNTEVENNVRLGDGQYENGERKISNVEVKLVDQENTIASEYMPKVAKSNDGTYSITGFIPGKYKLNFEWGDGTKGTSTDEKGNTIIYTVNDYKGTIWTDERQGIQGDYWYKEKVDKRYTDAKDDWDARVKLDAGESDSTTMTSSTDVFNIGIELLNNNSYSVDEVDNLINKDGRYIYVINNIDFGLAERPKQLLNIEKVVDKVKITLDNGQTVLDAKIDHSDGNNKGKFVDEQNIKFATYTPISEANPFGLIKYETDQYPLHLTVQYKIVLTNDSEIDYKNEDYYLYGKLGNENEIVKVKARKIYDYLDGIDYAGEIFEGSDISKDKEKVEQKTYDSYNKELKDLGIEETLIEKEYTIQTTDANGNKIERTEWEKSSKKIDHIFSEWRREPTETKSIREVKLLDKKILDLKALAKDDLKPGNSRSITIVGEIPVVSTIDNIEIKNDVEIAEVELKNNYGRRPSPSYTNVYDRGEIVTVTPPTGENKDYTLPVIITIVTMTILGIGIIIIKKKVLR